MEYINEQQEYWANPNDKPNAPTEYAKHKERSDYLMSILPKYVDRQDSILEIGCNVGRNLNALWESGYKKLSGLDINSNALLESERQYPDMNAHLINNSIEKWVLGSKKYDCIFSMAVMIHLPKSSDFVFSLIQNRAVKTIVTVEDEDNSTWKHFPRNYKDVFERDGWKEVFTETVRRIPSMDGYVTRVFKSNMV
jgi:2-polyprenyl-3-methyl-5-hydroxy-6-metoxy-1,4-benzoquinol methylase